MLRKGKRTRTKLLDVRAIASPLAHPRVGIVVPKRGRTTTDRNRLKRRLRELIRLAVLPDLAPVDVVVYARMEAYDASFRALSENLIEGIRRINRLLTQNERA